MVNADETVERDADSDAAPPPRSRAAPSRPVAIAFVAVLLLLGTWFDGAFAVADWAPIALFAFAALVVLGPGSRLGVVSHGPALLLAAFAVWSVVSLSWSPSASLGAENAGRNLLYAGLALLVVATLPARRNAIRLGALLLVALAAFVAVTLVLLVVQGKDLLLAGRLDVPVGYRNGTAAVMAMAAVGLICVAAPRTTQPLLRALAFCLAVVAIGLGFLTQSRGVVVGFAAGLVVVLALGPDRLRRAWLAIAAIALIAAISQSLLGPYDAFIARRFVTPAELDSATRALVFAAIGAFLGMAVVALLDSGLRLRDGVGPWLRPFGAVILVVLAVGAVGVAVARVGNPVTFASDKVEEFKTLEPTGVGGATRLGSTSGQRYDLWRIAARDFEADPVSGAGEGGYAARYYRERVTDRNLSVAHSLPLTVLGDTGAVGLVLFALAFVLGIGGLLLRWRHVEEGARRWASALVGAGAVLLVQASVDWLWSIAALGGLAVVLFSVGLRIVTAPSEAGSAAGRLASIPVRLGAAVAGLAVAAVFVSAVYVGTARARADEPERSLDAARTAARFNPLAVAPLYLQAGALESQGDAENARSALEEALRLEPRSFVTMALLGDLETRAGRARAARGWYARALSENPRDVGLQTLAAANG